MFRDYVEKAYVPLAHLYRRRTENDCAKARNDRQWAEALRTRWSGLHIERPSISRTPDYWRVSVPVFLGEIAPTSVQVQLFADVKGDKPAEAVVLYQEQAIPGAMNGFIYAGEVTALRPADDYTVRVVPNREGVQVPAELSIIAWQR